MVLLWPYDLVLVDRQGFQGLDSLQKCGYPQRTKDLFPFGYGQAGFNKLWYVGLLIALPIAIVPVSPLLIVGGFLLMHFICGLILALIFQPAHVLEETEFLNEKRMAVWKITGLSIS